MQVDQHHSPWWWMTSGLLGAAAGAALYLWVEPCVVAAIVLAWYVFESLTLIWALFGREQRGTALVYVLPRAIGSAVAFVASYALLRPWTQVIASAYLLLIALEGAYRLALRLWRRELFDRARAALPSAGESPETHETRPWARRAAWAARYATTVLFAVTAVLALWLYGAREAVFDARTYAELFEDPDLYGRLLDLAADLGTDLARSQGSEVRRGAALLSEEDVRLAARLLLPQEWTAAVAEQALGATLSWLEGGAERRVPPVSVPLDDVKRHVKDAVSVTADRVMADLPICAPSMPAYAFCRMEQMSVAAHVATYKPEAMRIVDESFALIPGDLDLATAVSLVPRTFEQPLAALSQVGQRLQAWDSVLAWLGVACVVLLAVLWLLSAMTADRPLLWLGAALLAAGVGSWAVSWTLSILRARSVFQPTFAALLSGVPEPMSAIALPALQNLLRAVHARISVAELLLAFVGLLVLLIGVAVPETRRRRGRAYDAVRAAVVVLAACSLLWTGYLSIGRRAYERAYAAHQAGDVAGALPVYRALGRAYPLEVADWVPRARRGLRECERYQAAEAARQAGDPDTAVAHFEALLAGNPAVAVRELAEADLVAALYDGAALLWEGGENERALDRYRYVYESYPNREVQQMIADLYLAWGDELLAAGDYGAAVKTYGRVVYDVSNPRLWRTADDRRVEAYCAWHALLRAQDETAQAAGVCAELRAAYPQVGEGCVVWCAVR